MPNDEKPDRARVRLGLAVIMGALLSGCIMVPVGRRQVARRPERDDDGDDDDEVVEVAPPAPQVDVVIAAPGPGYFWIGGHWGWIGRRHAWIGGRWEAHRPSWLWVPFAWTRHRHGWRARPGRWQRH